MSIKTIKIEVSEGNEIELSLEDAKKLHGALSELFGQSFKSYDYNLQRQFNDWSRQFKQVPSPSPIRYSQGAGWISNIPQ